MERFILSIGILAAFCVPAFATAATLSLTGPQASVGMGEPFIVSVILDTGNAVNAVEAALVIPSGLEFENTSDGNSIVNLWIERPRYDRKTRVLHFSGIIPGGFSGTGQLLRITLKAETSGSSVLTFDRTRTAAYRNSPDGTPETITLRPLTVYAAFGAARTPTPAADSEPPEAFTPVVMRDPQMYDGAWTLIFATQDKGSGIAYYEVSESSVRIIDPAQLSWTRAESPYRLPGEPARYIYVRAVDEQGNVQTALYTQAHPLSWFGGLMLGILIGTLVLFAFWLQRKKRRHASL